MKITIKVFTATGNPFRDLEGCMPKVLHSIAILFDEKDANSKVVEALNKYSLAVFKKSFDFKPNQGVELEGSNETKLFLSDLKYNVIEKDDELAKFKVLVMFDPSNRKLMSLKALCDSIEVYTQAQIDNEYQDLGARISTATTDQDDSVQCRMM